MALDSSEIIDELIQLSPRHFEQFIADVWQERQGWQTEVMDKGPDKGLDVIGVPPNGGPKTAVQCKRYSKGRKVNSSHVREYSALRNQWSDVEGVTIATTGEFTKDALEIADRLNVKCIDGESLAEIIHHYDAEDILEWYSKGKPENW